MDGRTEKCGCKTHNVVMGGEPLVIWRGKYWRQDCAMRHAMRDADFNKHELDKLRDLMGALTSSHNKLTRLKERITRLPCSTCGNPVCDRFDFQGNNIMCRLCFNSSLEIGGEG